MNIIVSFLNPCKIAIYCYRLGVELFPLFPHREYTLSAGRFKTPFVGLVSLLLVSVPFSGESRDTQR